METYVLNFSHPLTAEQRGQIEHLLAKKVNRWIEKSTHFKNDAPFAQQVRQLLDSLEIPPTDWQTADIVIIPPGFSPAATILVVDVAARRKWIFPKMVRIRPVEDSLPPRYEVAEIVDVEWEATMTAQQQRDA